ncbi:MAG: diguanylate cyclase, partial [Rudaea sp.]
MVTATFNYWLVLLSVVVAIVDAYLAFSVYGRLARSRGPEAVGWIVLSGLAMGSGAWAMHFIAMLALDIGTPLGYDLWLAIVSLLPVAIAAKIVARWLTRPRATPVRAIYCGLILGAGIAATHFFGYAAMPMDPPIVWHKGPLALALACAMVGSIVALITIVRAGRERRRQHRVAMRWIASGLVGCTIAGVHYLAMAAAEIAPGARCLTAGASLRGDALGLVIAFVTLTVLISTLVISIVYQHVQRRQKRMDAALERAQNALNYQAFHDSLTGLPNRTYLVNALRKLLAESPDNLAVLFVDLDGFKTINDSLGHHAGDEFLRSVARAMRASVREGDTVARFGGDEFVIVLRAYGGPDNLIAICEKILELVSRPVQVSSHTVTVTPSIGIAVAPGDGEDADTLLRNADAAMYTVKEFGKFGFRFFERSMH